MRQINENEFASVTSKGAVLVEFGAEWCGPCKAMLPTLNRMSTEYSGKMEIVSVDIDHSPNLAAQHGVMSVPTMMLFKDGRIVERIVGATSETNLKKKIAEYVG
jgi:thioredoxin 1